MAQKRSRAVRPFEAMAHIDPNGSFLLALTHRSITRPQNSSGTISRVTDPVITELELAEPRGTPRGARDPMGADGSRRARAGLGGPDGPTPGRGTNPPGEARSGAAGRRRRRRRFMSVATGGRPRGEDAGKHFPTSLCEVG